MRGRRDKKTSNGGQEGEKEKKLIKERDNVILMKTMTNVPPLLSTQGEPRA